MKAKIRIGLVEDHKIVRQGVVSLLEDEPEIHVQFDVSNGLEALEAIKKKKIDVLLLDIEMPILDGKQTLKKVMEKYTDISVIMFSAYNEIAVVSECIAFGAKGFLPKNCDYNKLLDAISSVHEKGFYFDDVVSKALVSDVLSRRQYTIDKVQNPLSTRELSIIILICDGLKNKDIAEKLFISIRTVEGHRKKIAEKTETTNVVELVVYAIKHGIYKV
jgi:DNA-binding NarL/FixJ family response regulator